MQKVISSVLLDLTVLISVSWWLHQYQGLFSGGGGQQVSRNYTQERENFSVIHFQSTLYILLYIRT